MPKPEPILFAGPTLYRADGIPLPMPPGIRLLPPARRGDIARLRETEPVGTIILVDGQCHQNPEAGHIEIREALQAGWKVWGLSCIGAIRACEMRGLGMRGYGQMFDRFTQGEVDANFSDDEVAFLHEPAPPYRLHSEPLAHLRHALRFLTDSGHLSPAGQDAILQHLESLWFPERTLHLFGELLQTERITPESIADLRSGFDRFRVTTHDLERFLESGLWRNSE